MNLSEFIQNQAPILLDGAMGTELDRAGLEMGGQNCVSHPETVRPIHQAYASTGCDILTTNTLTMNRIYLETHGLHVDIREVNLAGAQLARSVLNSDHQFVLGDISSTGQFLQPYGDYSEDQLIDTFKEQAEALLAGGVDGFIVETMLDLREALCAVRACREVSSLPVLATLSFQNTLNGGMTTMGNAAGESALKLAEAGAMAVGANCGSLDPQETALVMAAMREVVTIPLIAQPNAGKPRLMEGRTIFDMTPESFKTGMLECLNAGATLIGGCCGTSPEHIRCVAEMLGKTILR